MRIHWGKIIFETAFPSEILAETLKTVSKTTVDRRQFELRSIREVLPHFTTQKTLEFRFLIIAPRQLIKFRFYF